MIPTNATIIRKAYDDFARGNIPGVLESFDAAISWHVPGHSPLSGDYKGHDEVVRFFKRTMELSGGIFAIEVQQVLAEENFVVALVTVKGNATVAPQHSGSTYGGLRTEKSLSSASSKATSKPRSLLVVEDVVSGEPPQSRLLHVWRLIVRCRREGALTNRGLRSDVRRTNSISCFW
jgi:ketosteroid isomerase-like protein